MSDSEWRGLANDLRNCLTRRNIEIDSLRAELERERTRLAACGVVALADTPGCAKRARDMHADYWSVSCGDVARRVDECIALRAERDRLREALDRITGCARCEMVHHPVDGLASEMYEIARAAIAPKEPTDE